jgi:hypothetical protein
MWLTICCETDCVVLGHRPLNTRFARWAETHHLTLPTTNHVKTWLITTCISCFVGHCPCSCPLAFKTLFSTLLTLIGLVECRCHSRWYCRHAVAPHFERLYQLRAKILECELSFPLSLPLSPHFPCLSRAGCLRAHMIDFFGKVYFSLNAFSCASPSRAQFSC